MGPPARRSRQGLAAGRHAPAARPVTVLVADHHAVFRAAVCEVIAATPGFEHVAEAASGAEAVRLAGALDPDLALLDERLPEHGGPDAARRIVVASPRTVVVLLSLDRGQDAPAAGAVTLRKQELSSRALQRLWARSRAAQR